MRLFKKRLPFSKHLRIDPPAPRPNRHGVAIVTMLKDEESYIDEWLAFHQAVGIRHFIIYDDGSTDGTASIIKARLSDAELTLVPWAGRMIDMSDGQQFNSQVVAFAHAILNFGAAFRWMALIDVDEFLLPKLGNTVEEALKGTGGFPNVSLPWHMFGTSGHKAKPDGGILRNFVQRATDPISRKKNATNFKCVVDPCEVTEVSVHQFETRQYGEMTCNDVGKVFTRKQRKTPDFYASQNLQLNHYYTKSLEEFEEKIRRGPVSPATRDAHQHRLRTALESIDSDVVEDRQIIDFIDENDIQL
ncbi:hypothetical protein IZ6_11000 [Terrihabitans soli]|uniref:Glycosyltransferase family 92 protein n=1 Tax=Terrihabitans soli TaxID=708113 RepID=A0A6S6QRJ9_9HYPH|nr:glycosyltransferase family 92 protein [Terrihabitans soli]BCJ90365.1 hypothetical protein IZ6_11000 [Terrihabitans soli]